MTSDEKSKEKLRALPNINDDHIAVLESEGLDSPEKLLPALKDSERWKSLHLKLKGIGPKTLEKWIAHLEGEIAEEEVVPEKAEEKEVVEEPKPEAVAPARPKVKRIVRRKVVVEKPPAEPPKAGAREEKPALEKKAVKEEVIEKERAEAEEPEEELEEEIEEEEVEEEEAEGEEEAIEVVEEGEYVPKKKPKLTQGLVDALMKRKAISSDRPKFHRQERFRYGRLDTGWRKPKGMHSKSRKRIGYRPKIVSVGYGGPKLARGLHSSGFEEVKVYTIADLERVSEPERQAIRIGHSVGQRKRELIIERADELGIRVLNRS